MKVSGPCRPCSWPNPGADSTPEAGRGVQPRSEAETPVWSAPERIPTCRGNGDESQRMTDPKASMASEVREAPDAVARQGEALREPLAELVRRLKRRPPEVVVT